VNVGLIRDEPLLAQLPRREAGATKFTSGQVLVAGGSPGLTGAPCMAALAAQRAGAGYVTVCAPSSLSLVFETRLLEVMTIALPDADGALTVEGVPRLLQAAERGGALVLGPGVGRSDAAVGFVRTVLSRVELPAVLDADGLNAYAGELARLAEDRRGAPLVLTPHEGELGRLLGVPSREVAAARLAHACEAARLAAAVVVLKGDDTLIAHPSGLVAVSSGATAALATAGTGDVLSGVIGALLAARVEPFIAAAAGVRLHALAGIRAADRHGRDGMIASDVIDQLAAVRTR
jgi:NAD(P)H-hydrate epimerase